MSTALFGNPLFAWLAVGAAAIPLIIHLLNRQRHREVPWAAMRFLLAANRKSIRRTRIEQWLLLALRTLVILLVPLAMAQPILEANRATPLLGHNRHHLLVIDNSMSMSAPASTGRRPEAGLARHLATAQALLDSFPDGDPVSVVTLAYPARLLNPDPARTRTRARQLLEGITVQDTRDDLRGGLATIMAVVDDPAAPDLERTVHLFSDFAAGLFRAADEDDAAGNLQNLADTVSRAATLTLYPLPQANLDNQAVAEVSVAPRMVAIGNPTRIQAVIANHSVSRSAERPLTLSVDGRVVSQHSVPPLDPGATHTAETTVEFDAAGLHTIECTLSAARPDHLPGDDVGRLVVEVKNHIPVLIVDGKPGATPLDGQAGYIATALAPRAHASDRTVIEPTIIAEHELPGIDVNRFDIVVLCNVRRLPSSEWHRLDVAARQGCGIVLFMGDLVDIEHYNTSAAALLPGVLTTGSHTPRGMDAPLAFDPQSVRGPLAAHFAGRKSSGLFIVGIHGTLDVEDDASDASGTRLLSYDNGRPAIITRAIGAGRSILVTTSANMDWSNLPAKGDFVTLVMALVRHAAPPNAPTWNVIAGHPVRSRQALGSPAAAAGARLRSADGTALSPQIDTEDDGYRFRFDGITHGGWYNLEGPASDGPVAANPDPAESALRRLSDEDIRRELGCPVEVVAPRRDMSLLGRTTAAGLAPLLIYAALMLMFAETMAALWFGRVRE